MTPEKANRHLVEMPAALPEKEGAESVEPADLQPGGADVSFVEADREHDAEGDAVAGSEFVDDRIRLD